MACRRVLREVSTSDRRRLDMPLVELGRRSTNMSLAATESPFPIPRGLALAMAPRGPAATGGVPAAKAGVATPAAAAPAIAFGVLAATSPALYIAIAATGDAPPAGRVARALMIGLGAFGIALAGLVMPAAFLALSSI